MLTKNCQKITRPIKEEYLKAYDYYNEHDYSPTYVAKKFNLDKKFLLRMIRNPICEVNGKYFFDCEEIDEFINLVNEYYETPVGTQAFLDKYHMKYDVWKKRLSILNLEIKERNLLEYNRSIFSKIDTEEKAYWLGFILADGNIYRKELRIKLGIKDLNHLKKFITFINGNEDMIKFETNNLYNNELCKVVLSSKEIVEDLKKYGIEYRKSTREYPFLELDEKLFRHYLRGFFDGDGCIMTNLSKIEFTSSFEMNNFLKEFFIEKFNVKPTKILQHGKITHYTISNKKDKELVLDYLYKDSSIYLDRKYELYCRFKSTLQKI